MIAALALLVALPLHAAGYRANSGETCERCHERETPGVYRAWADSAHPAKGVGCADCHGDDEAASHPAPGERRATVDIDACADCHPDETAEHRASRHAIGFRAGMGCTRNEPPSRASLAKCGVCHVSDTAEPRTRTECAMFLAQPPEMQELGCTSCHRVETGCDACHTPHRTDLDLVRSPLACATCHMGPDHPQYEMWKTSKHGVAWATLGPEVGPDCARCHMPAGTHDVSRGLTVGAFGQRLPDDLAAKARDEMVDVCAECHAPGFARRSLELGDAVWRDTGALVVEAQGIVRELGEEGLLMPAPDARPPHPLSGPNLELGLQMTYDDLSRPEVLYFRLRTFSYLTAWKGAYHQSPDYAHWYGNAPLKMQLGELRSEAEALRRLRRLEERVDLLERHGALPAGEATDLETELRALKERHLRGEIDDDAYDAERRRLLDAAGL